MNNCQGWLIFALIALITPTGIGCRTPAGVDELERELRYQEDMIYDLQNYVRTYRSHLDECRKENHSLRDRLGDDAPTVDDDAEEIEIPDGRFVPPVIELPDLGTPIEGDPYESSLNSQSNQFVGGREEPKDQVIVELALDEQTTGGLDTDGFSGDEGIRVLLKPKNTAGETVRAAGEISLALLDPAAETAEEARVALWKFAPEEVAQRSQRRTPGKGLYLKLQWPDDAPHRRDLQLFARLITPDGRRLVADQMITVKPFDLEARRSASLPKERPDGFSVLKHGEQDDRLSRPINPHQQNDTEGWSSKPSTRQSLGGPATLLTPRKTASPPRADQSGLQTRTEQMQSPAEQKTPERSAIRRPQWSPYR